MAHWSDVDAHLLSPLSRGYVQLFSPARFCGCNAMNSGIRWITAVCHLRSNPKVADLGVLLALELSFTCCSVAFLALDQQSNTK
ncbi:hypothetical protein Y032_0035g2993 [Ancylostoma ceylanicum]|uniref:Uncharacterized protein n=1 Tax=Ancylostoma ceylanicum TaxID=53326 RepID=A0A016ULV7_9BILA|nr:hypothetical protein Y032_0035g2993 [Ancylostoma ceylanicum]